MMHHLRYLVDLEPFGLKPVRKLIELSLALFQSFLLLFELFNKEIHFSILEIPGRRGSLRQAVSPARGTRLIWRMPEPCCHQQVQHGADDASSTVGLEKFDHFRCLSAVRRASAAAAR